MRSDKQNGQFSSSSSRSCNSSASSFQPLANYLPQTEPWLVRLWWWHQLAAKRQKQKGKGRRINNCTNSGWYCTIGISLGPTLTIPIGDISGMFCLMLIIRRSTCIEIIDFEAGKLFDVSNQMKFDTFNPSISLGNSSFSSSLTKAKACREKTITWWFLH